MMRLSDLRAKEVINLQNGCRLGFVYDVEIDIDNGKICKIIVPGPLRWFGLLGRYDDYCIPWCDIEKIGEDIIFVRWEQSGRSLYRKKRRNHGGFF